jgi:hypothetical protein
MKTKMAQAMRFELASEAGSLEPYIASSSSCRLSG